MRTQLEATNNTIKRVSYTHDALIDYLIANPGCGHKDLAEEFGYSVNWIGRILNSDAFNVVLAKRKSELIDPVIVASAEENMKSVLQKSMELVIHKLNQPPMMNSLVDVTRVMEVASRALGYGAKIDNQTNTQINNIAIIPAQVKNSLEWAEQYDPSLKQVNE